MDDDLEDLGAGPDPDAPLTQRPELLDFQVEAVEGGVEIIDPASGEILGLQAQHTPAMGEFEKTCCEMMETEVQVYCALRAAMTECYDYAGVSGWTCEEEGQGCTGAFSSCHLIPKFNHPACEDEMYGY